MTFLLLENERAALALALRDVPDCELLRALVQHDDLERRQRDLYSLIDNYKSLTTTGRMQLKTDVRNWILSLPIHLSHAAVRMEDFLTDAMLDARD